MTERERLIELLSNIDYACDNGGNLQDRIEYIADYLLKNGVIALPCKVGDIMYYIGKSTDLSALHNTIYKSDVVKIIHKEEGISIVLRFYNGPYCFAEITDINDFGKRIFLTKEEAEKALHKINHNSLCDTETYKADT